MADNSLEDLLQEALADFEESQPAPAASAPARPTEPATSASRATPEPTAASNAEPTPTNSQPSSEPTSAQAASAAAPKAAPKGLGLGRGLGGSDPLSRKPRKSATPATAQGQDASAGAGSSSSKAAEDSSSGAGGDAGGKAGRKLAPEAQRLADDLMNLLQEAGLGGDAADEPEAEALAASLAGMFGGGNPGAAAGPAPGPTGQASSMPPDMEGDPFAQLFGRMLGGMMPSPGAADAGSAGSGEGAPPDFAAMLQQMMMAGEGMGAGPAPQAPAAAAAAGPSGSAGAGAAAAGDDDALSSSRLAGLAKQTLKTVNKQAKKTRGHVEGGGAAGRGAGASGSGGLPFGPGGAGGLGGMLRELGGLAGAAGGGGEGEGAPPAGVNMMVDYIMQHLLSKDVLYGPLKEIRDRYPPWLESHQGSLPAEDYGRYVAQYEAVQRVCAHYESAPGDFAKLMDLIQEMQTYGDPPGDIVEEITGGAGRDLNSILNAEETGPTEPQPALEELSGELDKCKVQ